MQDRARLTVAESYWLLGHSTIFKSATTMTTTRLTIHKVIDPIHHCTIIIAGNNLESLAGESEKVQRLWKCLKGLNLLEG